MSTTTRSALDTWNEFAAAAYFVADVERPGLTVWGALAEALGEWVGESGDGHTAAQGLADPLRAVLRHAMDTIPELGAPGGVRVEAILEAAMSDWTIAASSRVNDGRSFARADLVYG